MEIFGIPTQALFGQLLIGLINGAFYAMLSLGLAVIFGLLNIINFTHGAQYMMGAFCAWFLLEQARPRLLVVAADRAARRSGSPAWSSSGRCSSRLYKLDHLYGLLLTFGLALVVQGLFRNDLRLAPGCPTSLPDELAGGINLGFMFLPKYRAWVIVASLLVCLATWYVIERTKLGLVPARRDRESRAGPGVRHQRAADDHADVWLRRRARRARRRDGRADLPGQPADGRRHDHRRVRRRRDRRHGVDPGLPSSPASASASSRASPRCSIRRRRTR